MPEEELNAEQDDIMQLYESWLSNETIETTYEERVVFEIINNLEERSGFSEVFAELEWDTFGDILEDLIGLVEYARKPISK